MPKNSHKWFHNFPSRYEEKNVEFKHVYEITNEGPSYTNKPTRIDISFPNDMITLDPRFGNPKVGDTICQKSGSSGSFQTGIPLQDYSYTNAKSCDTVQCMTYVCTVAPGWEINTPKSIDMNFVFDGKKASEDTDNFDYAIFSSIRINGEKGT